MSSEINRFFTDDVSSFTRSLAELDRELSGPEMNGAEMNGHAMNGAEVNGHALPRLDDCLERLSDAIGRSRDACRRIEDQLRSQPLVLKEVQARFRDEIRPWFDKSWFMHRARAKPRGYPGDYELLSAIYDGEAKAKGLGGCLDQYFLQTDLGRAVQARMQAIRGFLIEVISHRQGDVTILDVACGPCREYLSGPEWNVVPSADRRVHLTCIDSDQQALDYVREHVAAAGIAGMEVRCVCYNALRMSSARANLQKFGRCDIIYSVGLCDYIPDKYLVPMLRGLRETLADDGVVYVAFKDCLRYDKTEYQWHVDWHFFQRTEEECRELFRQAGYEMDFMETTRDDTGVILTFIWYNKVGAIVRLDDAEQEVPAQPIIAIAGGITPTVNGQLPARQ